MQRDVISGVTDLRKLARGQDCTVRLPGICNSNPETTVLAHYRLAGVSGIGIKSPDVIGAWCCSACHDAIDGRIRTNFEHEWLRLCHAEGMMRTLAALDRMGFKMTKGR